MSGDVSAVSPTSAARTTPPTALPPDPVADAKAMIAQNRSARTGINYGELLRDIDQLNAKDGAYGAQVENAIKAELGPANTKKLMNASYSIRTKDGSTLVMARNAPSIEQYYKGTAHASLGKTPEERKAYAASDKAHYARLDKMFGDGNAKTFEGAKIQEGLNDLLSRGYTLDQVAQYKAEKAAEAKAAAEANGGPSGTQVALDLTQMALDLAGIVDPTGVADGGNAVISLGRTFSSLFSGEWKEAGGHFVNGLISVAGILPYLGDLAKAGKFGKWVQTVTDAITLAAKNPALAAKFGEGLKEIRSLLNKIPQSAIDALPADAQKSLMALKTKLDNFFNVGAKAADDLLSRATAKLGTRPLNSASLDELYKAGKLSMDEARALAQNAGWKSADGKWIYPPNDGVEGIAKTTEIVKGSKIDRYGGWVDASGKFRDTGNFASPAGSSYTSRALPPGTREQKPFTVYEVVKPFNAEVGKATAWFGEAGGGKQLQTAIDIETLVAKGYLKIVK